MLSDGRWVKRNRFDIPNFYGPRMTRVVVFRILSAVETRHSVGRREPAARAHKSAFVDSTPLSKQVLRNNVSRQAVYSGLLCCRCEVVGNVPAIRRTSRQFDGSLLYVNRKKCQRIPANAILHRPKSITENRVCFWQKRPVTPGRGR